MILPLLTKTGIRQYHIKHFENYVFLPHIKAYAKVSDKNIVEIPTIWGRRKVSTEEIKHFFEFHVKHYFLKKIGNVPQKAAILSPVQAKKIIPKHHQVIAEVEIATKNDIRRLTLKVSPRTKRRMKMSTAKRKAKILITELIKRSYEGAKDYKINRIIIRKHIFRKIKLPPDGEPYAPSKAS